MRLEFYQQIKFYHDLGGVPLSLICLKCLLVFRSSRCVETCMFLTDYICWPVLWLRIHKHRILYFASLGSGSRFLYISLKIGSGFLEGRGLQIRKRSGNMPIVFCSLTKWWFSQCGLPTPLWTNHLGSSKKIQFPMTPFSQMNSDFQEWGSGVWIFNKFFRKPKRSWKCETTIRAHGKGGTEMNNKKEEMPPTNGLRQKRNQSCKLWYIHVIKYSNQIL